MLKKYVLLFGLLVMSLSAQATLISHFDYKRDSASNIVTGGGLEWLKWDVTKGMSVNTALSSYASQGWRLASNIEMATLFNDFQFGPHKFTDTEADWQYTERAWDKYESSNYIAFIAIFGETATGGYPVCDQLRTRNCYDSGEKLVGSFATYGSDDNKNGYYNHAFVQDDFSGLDAHGMRFEYASAAYLMPDQVEREGAYIGVGVALVRFHDKVPIKVPTPGSIGLLALGLVALGLRRRQALRR